MSTRAYATTGATAPLAPFSIERRAPRERDVVIDITHCGVCHSDVHQARNEWGGAIYPMVPGHEIIGRVASTGAGVTAFRAGDHVGVGCMIASCQQCASCKEGLEQYCERGFTGTYSAYERPPVKGGEKTLAQGGYSERIVVDERFVLRIPAGLDPARTAPLLCAGITTYSPLRRWNVRAGQRVGVVGLGGLGHVAVKLARAMGAEVVVLTTSTRKKDDALALGAHEVVVSTDLDAMKAQSGRFQFVLDTVSAPHDIGALLGLLRRDGVLTLVGAPDKPFSVGAFGLIMGRRTLAGSLIGGVRETQEMLDFCAEHGVLADVEVIPIQRINVAYDRLVKSDVKYRFVIDTSSLAAD